MQTARSSRAAGRGPTPGAPGRASSRPTWSAWLAPLVLLLFAAAAPIRADEPEGDPVAAAKRTLLEVVVGTEEQSAQRAEAVAALGRFDSPAAVAGLVEALDRLEARTTKLEADAAKTRQTFGPYRDPASARDPEQRRIRDRLMKQMSEQDSILRGDFTTEQAFSAAVASLTDAAAVAATDRAAARADLGRTRMVLYCGLLRNPAARFFDVVRRAMSDSDPVVRDAAAAVIPARKDPESVPVVAKLLGHADFGVRSSAVKALHAWGDVRAVSPLISALATDDGALANAYVEALKSLTGANIGADAAAWRKWFAMNKVDLAEKAAKSGDATSPGGKGPPPNSIDLGDVKIHGRKICFVLDISGSMNEEMGKEGVTGQWLSGKKLDIAKKMMRNYITKLPDGVFFNVIAYNHEVFPLEALPIETTIANRHLMIQRIDELVARGATWTYGALKTAFGQMSNSTGIPYDTIVLLSDGAPTEYLPEGEVDSKPQNPDVVLTAVKKWNAWGAVTIHTIAIDPRITSATVGGNFIRFMRELAALNNGTSLQVGADTHAPPPLPGK